MKKIIYIILSITMLTACKKESSNPTTTPTNSNSTAISKYGNGVTDIEGNRYKTVIIGSQEWMGENLKVSTYNDGTILPNLTQNSEWKNNTTGAWSFYNNDATNNSKYGKLYNWYTVSYSMNGNKNVCPTSWHVPSDSEWSILIEYLGGESTAGGKMKEVGESNWQTPNINATNKSLFSALPGGNRNDDGTYYGIRKYGNWWSSTSELSQNNYWNFHLHFDDENIGKGHEVGGLSIRCIKD
jgi:uncharacterized protein (TIGR02145 family)